MPGLLEKRLKFPAMREHFGIFGGGLKLLQGITKNIPPLYLRKKSPGTAGNLKVNEQSKYKSVPILFLFLVIEGKPEIYNS